MGSSLSFVDLFMKFGSDFQLAFAPVRRKMPPFLMQPLNCAPALPPPPGCPSPGMLVVRLKTANAVPASSSCAVHESLLENFEKLE